MKKKKCVLGIHNRVAKKTFAFAQEEVQLHERKNQLCEEQRTIQKKSCVLQEGLFKEKRSRLEVLGRGQIMMQKRKTL